MKRLLILTVLVILLCRQECAAQSKMAQLLERYGVTTHENLSYVPASKNPEQTLDLYIPSADQNKDGRLWPVVVWVHGGGWRSGDKTQGPFPPLLRAGYAVASVNYRLTQEAKFPAQIYDVKAAVRWLRAHAKDYGLDANHIGAWGASAGGHLVALLGTSADVKALEGDEGNNEQSSSVQAVCDYSGPTDFNAFRYNAGNKPVVEALLGSLNKESAAKASPITYVSKSASPFFIAHGDQDHVVPVEQSKMLAAALQRSGVTAELHVVPGADHGLSQAKSDLVPLVIKFFDSNLKEKN